MENGNNYIDGVKIMDPITMKWSNVDIYQQQASTSGKIYAEEDQSLSIVGDPAPAARYLGAVAFIPFQQYETILNIVLSYSFI